MSTHSGGERRLMCAVLEDAIECLAGPNACRRPQLAAKARGWFENRGQRWLFSFESICAALDLDAGRVRAWVLDGAGALRPRNPAPAADRELIRSMILAGHSLRTVAETVGLSIAQVSSLPQRLTRRLRESRDAEIRRLRREGWAPWALAQRFALSKLRVTRICARPDSSDKERQGPDLDLAASS